MKQYIHTCDVKACKYTSTSSLGPPPTNKGKVWFINNMTPRRDIPTLAIGRHKLIVCECSLKFVQVHGYPVELISMCTGLMYMNTHAHTCSHMHTHAHTCSHMHTHAHTCVHMLTHVHTCSHMHTHAHTCTHMLTHVHTCTPPILTWKVLRGNHLNPLVGAGGTRIDVWSVERHQEIETLREEGREEGRE